MEHSFALRNSEFGQMVPEHGLGADRGHGAGQLRPRHRADHEILRLPTMRRRQAPARCYGRVFLRKLCENGVQIGVLRRPDEARRYASISATTASSTPLRAGPDARGGRGARARSEGGRGPIFAAMHAVQCCLFTLFISTNVRRAPLASCRRLAQWYESRCQRPRFWVRIPPLSIGIFYRFVLHELPP